MEYSQPLKEHIERMLCPIHDIHPMVEDDFDGVKIVACCKDFELECLKHAENIIGQTGHVKDMR